MVTAVVGDRRVVLLTGRGEDVDALEVRLGEVLNGPQRGLTVADRCDGLAEAADTNIDENMIIKNDKRIAKNIFFCVFII